MKELLYGRTGNLISFGVGFVLVLVGIITLWHATSGITAFAVSLILVGMAFCYPTPWWLWRRQNAFKITLTIIPHWYPILTKSFPQLKELPMPEIKQHIEDYFVSDERLKLAPDASRLNQLPETFVFSIFIDEATGLKLIWSDHDKCFRNDARTFFEPFRGGSDIDHILETDPELKAKMRSDLLCGFFFSPEALTTPNFTMKNQFECKDEIYSGIPFLSIFALLLQTHKRGGNPMSAIKSFGTNLDQLLAVNHVTYDRSRNFQDPESQMPDQPGKRLGLTSYDHRNAETFSHAVRSHGFKTAYYDLWVGFGVFEPERAFDDLTDGRGP